MYNLPRTCGPVCHKVEGARKNPASSPENVGCQFTSGDHRDSGTRIPTVVAAMNRGKGEKAQISRTRRVEKNPGYEEFISSRQRPREM